MTHDELLAKISNSDLINPLKYSLRKIMWLHRPWTGGCTTCNRNGGNEEYPCKTIQAIEKELK